MTIQLIMKPCTMADSAALYQMSTDDIADRISAMRDQELSSAYWRVDYLGRQPSAIIDHDDHKTARSKMCRWCYEVIDACSLSRHAVFHAMNCLDRFLATLHPRAKRSLLDIREYQLAAVAALYVSVKVHEPPAPDAGFLAEIGGGCYDTEEILGMERAMLEALAWSMNAPTSGEFVCLFLGLLDPEAYGRDLDLVGGLLDVAAFQCELATDDYELSNTCSSSDVALASILNGIEGVDRNVLPNRARYAYLRKLGQVLRDNGGIDMDRLRCVRARLRKLLTETPCGDFSAAKEEQEEHRKQDIAEEISVSKNISRITRGHSSIGINEKTLRGSIKSIPSPLREGRWVSPGARDSFFAKCA